MSKPIKDIMTRELASRYAQTTNAIWVELVGVDGITTNEFRRDLRSRHMRLEVVRTSLLQRACQGGPLARLVAELRGPAALVTGGESAIDVAKVLETWLPKLQTKLLTKLRLRGAVLDGEYLDESRVKELAKMPSKCDLQSRLVTLILTPGGRLAGALLAPASNLAGCIKALIEKLEKAEPAAASEPVAASEPAVTS